MKKDEKKIIITIGFALFAIFFGAGNLILPPYIGLHSASDWAWAILGFTLTGIIAPFLGILAIAKVGDNVTNLRSRIHPLLITLLITITLWLIGPLIAIPRTGATVFEMGIHPIFPSISPVIGSVLFFGITGLLAASPSKIIDIIGKYLTPILLVLLLSLVGIGFFSPTALPVASTQPASKSFIFGFLEGYQTMDMLASVVFAGIIILAVKAKGYSKTKEKMKITLSAGLLSMFFLFIVYGGLIYLGATSGIVVDQGLSRTALLLSISDTILGDYGVYLLSAAISLACLTTAIALTTAFAKFMEELTKGKLGYKWNVLICCSISTFLATNGVDQIIEYAGSLLGFVYPMVFVIVISIVFLNKTVRAPEPYIITVLITGLFSILPVLGGYGIATDAIKGFRTSLPLVEHNLEWALPAIIVFTICSFIFKSKEKTVQKASH